MTKPTILQMRPAESRREVLLCQNLIAQVYNREYGVRFSADSFDLKARIEPWPHRYLFGTWQGDHACVVGLYLSNTYVERFGNVSRTEIDRVLSELEATSYSSSRLREVTKVVVAPRYRGRGLARVALAAAHTRAFLQQDTIEPAAVLSCAKLSIYERLLEPLMSMHRLTDFPYYQVHERYRSPEDPMESRIVIPDLDIPSMHYDRKLPGTFEVYPARGQHQRHCVNRGERESLSPRFSLHDLARGAAPSHLGAVQRPTRSDARRENCSDGCQIHGTAT